MKSGSRSSNPVHGLFADSVAQILRVSGWNRQFNWGIPDEAFAVAERSVPVWPDEKLVAAALVPYLADKTNEDGTAMTGVERTFHELWARASAEQVAHYRWNGYDVAGSDRLRLHAGIEHLSAGKEVSALRWEVIDLDSNRNQRPMVVRSAESSPHAGILAAAALHPQWIKDMDGDKVPYVSVLGYEVQAPEGKPWALVPSLRFDRFAHEIQLDYCWCRSGGLLWSSPAFFRK